VLPVLTRDEMRVADAAALVSVSHATLVNRAGTAVAHVALQMLGGAYGKHVVVVAGKGSNGADAGVAAALLARRGARITMIGATDAPATLPECDLLIDGAYGTGFHGVYDAPHMVPGTPVLAVDIPSGVDADTGVAEGSACRATHTVTFAALKPGLLQGAGPRHSGQVEVIDIGIGLGTVTVALVEDADVAAWLPKRTRQSNKWTTAVGIAAGSVGMEGSAVLCTRGAMAAGAGMIRLGSPGDPYAAWPTEAVRMSLPERGWAPAFLAATAKCKALVIGPGLGTDPATSQEIRSVIVGSSQPMVIDADAITALGDVDSAGELLRRRTGVTVLTPHDGEFARMSGSGPDEDRVASVRSLMHQIPAIVLLKGPLTAVGHADGPLPDVLLVSAGVTALATAGTGDVLSGMIGAFMARGVPAHQAAALAAHVHGRAAAAGQAEGLVAGDLPKLVSEVLSAGLTGG